MRHLSRSDYADEWKGILSDDRGERCELMKKHMLSLLIVLCGAIVVVLLFAQNHISGKRIADIIEEGDIDRISVEKWQVVDSKLVLTDSNEYAYNGNELVHDISQLKLKNIHTKPVYNMQESNERCITNS